MKTDKARNLYARRQQLSEPAFGILKEQLGARRFLLRGLKNVRAEFTLMAAAFNIRTLLRVWRKAKNVTYLVFKRLSSHICTHSIFRFLLRERLHEMSSYQDFTASNITAF
jgi:hypothetical protein